MEEIWKPINEVDGFYEVSDFGRGRSVARKVRFGRYPMIVGGKIMKLRESNNGYLRLSTKLNNKNKAFLIHRLVAKYFIDNPLSKPEVNHLDGDKTNNHVSNLEWCTRRENVNHAVKNGLTTQGERHGSAKLTKQKVLAIRRLYKFNKEFNRVSVARKLGVSDSAVANIIYNRSWKHI